MTHDAAAAHDVAERVLNVYNWSDFIEPSVVADFEKEFGIKVRYDVYSSNETMEVKLLAGHSGYDVAVPGGAFFEKELKAGVYQKLDKTLLRLHVVGRDGHGLRYREDQVPRRRCRAR